jgi:hypothetical protein
VGWTIGSIRTASLRRFPQAGYLNHPGLFDLPEPLLYQWDDLHRPEYLDPLGLHVLDLPEPLRPEQLNPPRLEDQPPAGIHVINNNPIVERQDPPQRSSSSATGSAKGT